MRNGEGWLSEETSDNKNRLNKSRVWVVDPIDGTREFLAGIPEWVVSIGLVEHGRGIAAGIVNPLKGELFVGDPGLGATMNGVACKVANPVSLDGAKVLASRSELRDGRWEKLKGTSMQIIPKGSIAYKLALVAAGLVDATISLAPKHEWDVAAGVLLVQVAGGVVTDLSGNPIRFNQEDTLLNGVIAAGPNTHEQLWKVLRDIG